MGRRAIWLQWTGKIRNWAVKFMYRRQSEMLGTGYMFLVSLCGLVVSLILVSIMMPISLMVVQNIINQLLQLHLPISQGTILPSRPYMLSKIKMMKYN